MRLVQVSKVESVTQFSCNYTIIHHQSDNYGQTPLDNRSQSYHIQEDQHITRLVSRFGTKKWPLVSERLCAETPFERTGKQCRERWYNHLSPEISQMEWSEEDQSRLFEAHKQYGNKWKIISRLFEGRTDNSIKNHFYSTIRRCLRRINKLQGEKNSTLKMRSIKPYVLSKILADRSLTESILQLGKIKPNKSKRQIPTQHFQQFNRMINKLYQINQEYQTFKQLKKDSKDHSHSDLPSHENLPSLHLSPIPSQRSQVQSIQKSILFESTPPKTVRNQSKKSKLSKRSQVLIRRKSKVKTQKIPQLHIYQPRELNEIVQDSSKRVRKSINYLKLNEGILCGTKRSDFIQETRQEIKIVKNNITSLENIHITDHLWDDQHLQQILQEERSQGKEGEQIEQHNYSLLSHDQIDHKAMRHFDIANPSPCYSRSPRFFDELVVIGTKILTTPREERRSQEGRSPQREIQQGGEQFIEQILEIDFDPDFAMHYGQE